MLPLWHFRAALARTLMSVPAGQLCLAPLFTRCSAEANASDTDALKCVNSSRCMLTLRSEKTNKTPIMDGRR
jgi:hypothetical protein